MTALAPVMTIPFEATGMVPPPPGIHPLPMSRPQVGIERLPARRMSNEPRESMNCKSCRKRKVQYNPLETLPLGFDPWSQPF